MNADEDILDRGRAGHPARRGLDPLLFHLFAGALQTAAAAKHRVPEGRLQRAAAGAAQARASQNPAGALLRGGRGAVRALQEKPAGRDLRRGVRAPPQRPAREREARRRHRPLPPHQGGQPADARTVAVVAGGFRQAGRASWAQDSSPRTPRRCSRSCTTTSPKSSPSATFVFKDPRHGRRDRPREGPDADAADDRHDPRPRRSNTTPRRITSRNGSTRGDCSRWRRRSASTTRATSRRSKNTAACW